MALGGGTALFDGQCHWGRANYVFSESPLTPFSLPLLHLHPASPHLLLPAQTYNNRNKIWLLICPHHSTTSTPSRPRKPNSSQCWDLFVQSSRSVSNWSVGLEGRWCNESVQLQMFVFILAGLREPRCVSECSWSHYGCSNLHLKAAICWMFQVWCHGLYTGVERHGGQRKTERCRGVFRLGGTLMSLHASCFGDVMIGEGGELGGCIWGSVFHACVSLLQTTTPPPPVSVAFNRLHWGSLAALPTRARIWLNACLMA